MRRQNQSQPGSWVAPESVLRGRTGRKEGMKMIREAVQLVGVVHAGAQAKVRGRGSPMQTRNSLEGRTQGQGEIAMR